MSIIRIAHRSGYTTVANSTAQDRRLSFEARGLLLYLLSKPDDWEIRFTDVEREGGIGRDKRQRLFSELESAGYFERVEARDGDGCFGYDYIAYEVSFLPQPDFQVVDNKEPQPDLPLPDLPEPDFQVADNIDLQIPDLPIPERIQNTESSLPLPGMPIRIFRDYFPRYEPTHYQIGEILREVRDIEAWRKACAFWAGNKYKASSVASLMDYYKRMAALKPADTNQAQVANDFDACPICDNGLRCPVHGGKQ